MARQLARVLPLLPIDVGPDARFDDRVAALVDQRFRLFATLGQAAGCRGCVPRSSPGWPRRLTESRRFLRGQVRTLFAPELAAMGDGAAEAALAAADVLTTFESYQLLTVDRGFDHDRGPEPSLAGRADHPARPRGHPMTARRGSMRHADPAACPADTVWDVVGAPARLPEWWEGIDSCTVEGDERTIMTRSGLPMPERLLTIDPGSGGSSTGSPHPCSSSTSAPSTSTTSTTGPA